MPSHIPISQIFQDKVKTLAAEMSSWESKPRLDEETETHVRASIRSFPHTSRAEAFRVAGVDGSGDYPSFSYADSFVFVATASGAVFRTDALHGLVEEPALVAPNLELVWLPEDQERAAGQWIRAFSSLGGIEASDVVKQSDYSSLKRTHAGSGASLEHLVLPRASDTSNCGIQLRSCAEWGAALRLIGAEPACRYVLMDTTLSLPFIKSKDNSLFHEQLKRLCCVRARERGVRLFTVSKSHGLPSVELIENLARETQDVPASKTAEHWFLRLPIAGHDDWSLDSLVEGRQIPPVGAVSYLFRLHKNTPVMRLDMDHQWWEDNLRNDAVAESRVFEELDYCGHDQRSYGYPFPIKACHDRTRLSQAERLVIKKQIIDAAVAQGMKRSLFKDVSAATGHS